MRHVWFSEWHDPGPIDPTVIVRRNQVRIGSALIDEVFFNDKSRQSKQFLSSPFHRLNSEPEISVAIGPPGSDQAFPIFNDLAELGCTFYFATRLYGFSGAEQKIALAVDNQGGLSADQIDDLRWSLRLFTLLLNTLIEYGVKNTLAEVYVGHDPGRRVCSGMITRGQVVSIEGALWFSDICGFTKLSEDLSAADLVAALNGYYQEVVGAIYAQGGEVLKYIGDAVLAVFPSEKLGGAQAACLGAWAAAEDSRTRLSAFNNERRAAGLEPMEDSIALHFGVAQYGNIGSEERLDFTLIGREVNLASRVKSMTDATGASILCTDEFRRISGLPVRPLGSFSARGLHDPVAVFTPES
jgi:adenylate cyclase